MTSNVVIAHALVSKLGGIYDPILVAVVKLDSTRKGDIASGLIGRSIGEAVQGVGFRRFPPEPAEGAEQGPALGNRPVTEIAQPNWGYLNGVDTALAGAYANALFERGDEDFTVAGLSFVTMARGVEDGIDGHINELVVDGDLDLHLWN